MTFYVFCLKAYLPRISFERPHKLLKVLLLPKLRWAAMVYVVKSAGKLEGGR